MSAAEEDKPEGWRAWVAWSAALKQPRVVYAAGPHEAARRFMAETADPLGLVDFAKPKQGATVTVVPAAGGCTKTLRLELELTDRAMNNEELRSRGFYVPGSK